MSILAWIIVGLICGWLAKVVAPDVEPGGLLATLLVGAIGAFVGGWLHTAFTAPANPGMVNLHSVFFATLGAIVFLFIWKTLATGRQY